MKILLNNKIILKPQQKFKSEAHCVYTKNIKKISLISNDDKRLIKLLLIKLQHIHMEQMLSKYVKVRW